MRQPANRSIQSSVIEGAVTMGKPCNVEIFEYEGMTRFIGCDAHTGRHSTVRMCVLCEACIERLLNHIRAEFSLVRSISGPPPWVRAIRWWLDPLHHDGRQPFCPLLRGGRCGRLVPGPGVTGDRSGDGGGWCEAGLGPDPRARERTLLLSGSVPTVPPTPSGGALRCRLPAGCSR